MMRSTILMASAAAALVISCSAQPAQPAGSITLYSGREQDLVEPVFEAFTAATGIETDVRYGDSAALAAQILEEGGASPADVFFSQDAGALGALSAANLLAMLPPSILDRVRDGFRADDGTWIGVTGRVRTLVYNTDEVAPSDLPDSIFDLTHPRWNGKLGWAPTNASFQAFVTALRLEHGEQAARDWLRRIAANRPREYPKNTPIVEAVAAGEIQAGLVNHYYLLKVQAEDPDAPAANHFFSGGDVGGLVNVAGAGLLRTSDNSAQAREFVAFLLSDEMQRTFAEDTFEYPLVDRIGADQRLPELDVLEPPTLDLSRLADLQRTLDLLAQEGLV